MSVVSHHSQFIRSDVHVLDVPSTAHHCTFKAINRKAGLRSSQPACTLALCHIVDIRRLYV